MKDKLNFSLNYPMKKIDPSGSKPAFIYGTAKIPK